MPDTERVAHFIPFSFPQYIFHKIFSKRSSEAAEPVQAEPVQVGSRRPKAMPIGPVQKPGKRVFGSAGTGAVSSKTMAQNIEQTMRENPIYGPQINELLGTNPASLHRLQEMRDRFGID